MSSDKGVGFKGFWIGMYLHMYCACSGQESQGFGL